MPKAFTELLAKRAELDARQDGLTAEIVKIDEDIAALALQLPFSEMSALSGGLVSPAPE